MDLSELLTLIGFGLFYLAALITSIINIRLKLKELEIKIIGLENDLKETKIFSNKEMRELEARQDACMNKLEQSNTTEHNVIMTKIDIILEKITEIKVNAAKLTKDK
jgi:hypothetical protein